MSAINSMLDWGSTTGQEGNLTATESPDGHAYQYPANENTNSYLETNKNLHLETNTNSYLETNRN